MNAARSTMPAAAFAGLALVLAIGACGGGTTTAVPPGELAVAVVLPQQPVAFGAPFEVTVVRAWSTALTVEPWDDRALAPLVARTTATNQSAVDGREVETRTLTAHAFGLPTVELPGVLVRATAADGSEREHRGPSATVKVTPALGEGASATPELPPPLAEPGLSPWLYVLGAATVLLGAGLLYVRHRTAGDTRPPTSAEPRPASTDPTAGPTAADLALAQLRHLRQQLGPADTSVGAHVGAAAALRQFVGAQWGWAAERRTTEELLHLTEGVVDARGRLLLASALGPCDLVKFAGLQPTIPQAIAVLDAAEGFVRAAAAVAPAEAPIH